MGKSLQGKELGKGITQKKDGRYEARMQYNGHNIDLVNTSLTQLKIDFDKAKKDLVLSGIDNSAATNSSLCLTEWYNKWFIKYKAPQLKNEASINSYDRKCRNTYIDILGPKKIKDIIQLDIQTATYELIEKKYSERYIRDGLGILSNCFEVALANKYVTVNPCVSIVFPNKNSFHDTERRVLDKWELDIFKEVAKGQYYEELYMIMLCSGMRIGEVGGLVWENVDFINKVIRIRQALTTNYTNGQKIQEISTPKTSNSYREIPFFDETEELFKRWKDKQDQRRRIMGDRWRCEPQFGNIVFTTNYGSPVTKYVLQNDMNKIHNNMVILEKLRSDKESRLPRDIEHIHPHALRHTFCTILFTKGMDPVVIQRIMGHSNYSTTLGYTHLLKDKRDSEVAKIGSFFS